MGRLTPREQQGRDRSQRDEVGGYRQRSQSSSSTGSKRVWLPLLFLAAMGLFILTQEVPQVRDGVEQILRPAAWQARQVCRAAAMAAGDSPRYARILDRGNVHETTDGYLVEALTVGEMGVEGVEIQRVFNCYVDSTGKLVTSSSRPHQSQGSPVAERSVLQAEDLGSSD